MNQHKGDSECRPGVGSSTDELCGFEKLNRLQLFSPVSDPNQTFPPLNYVRNALEGRARRRSSARRQPVPARLIGSTDTHNATPGGTEEQRLRATSGTSACATTPTPAFMVAARHPGRHRGHARRPRRRVGGGELARRALRRHAPARGLRHQRHAADPALLRRPRAGAALRRSRLRRDGYAGGVPMGGEIGPVRGDRSPRFAVLAFRDPGTPGAPGTPLQRVQIVKGWVDAAGAVAREGLRRRRRSPTTAPPSTRTTCTPSGAGRRLALRGLERSRVRRRRSAPSTTRACSRTRPAAGARGSATRRASTAAIPALGPGRVRRVLQPGGRRRRSRSAPGRRRSGTAPRASTRVRGTITARRTAAATTSLDIRLDARRACRPASIPRRRT